MTRGAVGTHIVKHFRVEVDSRWDEAGYFVVALERRASICVLCFPLENPWSNCSLAAG